MPPATERKRYFLHSEVCRLILGFLKEEKYKKTYRCFLKECEWLKEVDELNHTGMQSTLTILGLSLTAILEDYGRIKLHGLDTLQGPLQISALWNQLDSVVQNLKSQTAAARSRWQASTISGENQSLRTRRLTKRLALRRRAAALARRSNLSSVSAAYAAAGASRSVGPSATSTSCTVVNPQNNITVSSVSSNVVGHPQAGSTPKLLIPRLPQPQTRAPVGAVPGTGGHIQRLPLLLLPQTQVPMRTITVITSDPVGGVRPLGQPKILSPSQVPGCQAVNNVNSSKTSTGKRIHSQAGSVPSGCATPVPVGIQPSHVPGPGGDASARSGTAVPRADSGRTTTHRQNAGALSSAQNQGSGVSTISSNMPNLLNKTSLAAVDTHTQVASSQTSTVPVIEQTFTPSAFSTPVSTLKATPGKTEATITHANNESSCSQPLQVSSQRGVFSPASSTQTASTVTPSKMQPPAETETVELIVWPATPPQPAENILVDLSQTERRVENGAGDGHSSKGKTLVVTGISMVTQAATREDVSWERTEGEGVATEGDLEVAAHMAGADVEHTGDRDIRQCSVTPTHRSKSPKRKKKTPRKRSDAQPMQTDSPSTSLDGSTSSKQNLHEKIPLERILNNEQIAKNLADHINKTLCYHPAPQRSTSTETPGASGTIVNTSNAVGSIDAISTDSILDEVLSVGHQNMSEDKVNDIIKMTRNDPVFDSLFELFNADKEEYIQREFGQDRSAPSTPAAARASGSGTVPSTPHTELHTPPPSMDRTEEFSHHSFDLDTAPVNSIEPSTDERSNSSMGAASGATQAEDDVEIHTASVGTSHIHQAKMSEAQNSIKTMEMTVEKGSAVCGSTQAQSVGSISDQHEPELSSSRPGHTQENRQLSDDHRPCDQTGRSSVQIGDQAAHQVSEEESDSASETSGNTTVLYAGDGKTFTPELLDKQQKEPSQTGARTDNEAADRATPVSERQPENFTCVRIHGAMFTDDSGDVRSPSSQGFTKIVSDVRGALHDARSRDDHDSRSSSAHCSSSAVRDARSPVCLPRSPAVHEARSPLVSHSRSSAIHDIGRSSNHGENSHQIVTRSRKLSVHSEKSNDYLEERSKGACEHCENSGEHVPGRSRPSSCNLTDDGHESNGGDLGDPAKSSHRQTLQTEVSLNHDLLVSCDGEHAFNRGVRTPGPKSARPDLGTDVPRPGRVDVGHSSLSDADNNHSSFQKTNASHGSFDEADASHSSLNKSGLDCTSLEEPDTPEVSVLLHLKRALAANLDKFPELSLAHRPFHTTPRKGKLSLKSSARNTPHSSASKHFTPRHKVHGTPKSRRSTPRDGTSGSRRSMPGDVNRHSDVSNHSTASREGSSVHVDSNIVGFTKRLQEFSGHARPSTQSPAIQEQIQTSHDDELSRHSGSHHMQTELVARGGDVCQNSKDSLSHQSADAVHVNEELSEHSRDAVSQHSLQGVPVMESGRLDENARDLLLRQSLLAAVTAGARMGENSRESLSHQSRQAALTNGVGMSENSRDCISHQPLHAVPVPADVQIGENSRDSLSRQSLQAAHVIEGSRTGENSRDASSCQSLQAVPLTENVPVGENSQNSFSRQSATVTEAVAAGEDSRDSVSRRSHSSPFHKSSHLEDVGSKMADRLQELSHHSSSWHSAHSTPQHSRSDGTHSGTSTPGDEAVHIDHRAACSQPLNFNLDGRGAGTVSQHDDTSRHSSHASHQCAGEPGASHESSVKGTESHLSEVEGGHMKNAASVIQVTVDVHHSANSPASPLFKTPKKQKAADVPDITVDSLSPRSPCGHAESMATGASGTSVINTPPNLNPQGGPKPVEITADISSPGDMFISPDISDDVCKTNISFPILPVAVQEMLASQIASGELQLPSDFTWPVTPQKQSNLPAQDTTPSPKAKTPAKDRSPSPKKLTPPFRNLFSSLTAEIGRFGALSEQKARKRQSPKKAGTSVSPRASVAYKKSPRKGAVGTIVAQSRTPSPPKPVKKTTAKGQATSGKAAQAARIVAAARMAVSKHISIAKKSKGVSKRTPVRQKQRSPVVLSKKTTTKTDDKKNNTPAPQKEGSKKSMSETDKAVTRSSTRTPDFLPAHLAGDLPGKSPARSAGKKSAKSAKRGLSRSQTSKTSAKAGKSKASDVKDRTDEESEDDASVKSSSVSLGQSDSDSDTPLIQLVNKMKKKKQVPVISSSDESPPKPLRQTTFSEACHDDILTSADAEPEPRDEHVPSENSAGSCSPGRETGEKTLRRPTSASSPTSQGSSVRMNSPLLQKSSELKKKAIATSRNRTQKTQSTAVNRPNKNTVCSANESELNKPAAVPLTPLKERTKDVNTSVTVADGSVSSGNPTPAKTPKKTITKKVKDTTASSEAVNETVAYWEGTSPQTVDEPKSLAKKVSRSPAKCGKPVPKSPAKSAQREGTKSPLKQQQQMSPHRASVGQGAGARQQQYQSCSFTPVLQPVTVGIRMHGPVRRIKPITLSRTPSSRFFGANGGQGKSRYHFHSMFNIGPSHSPAPQVFHDSSNPFSPAAASSDAPGPSPASGRPAEASPFSQSPFSPQLSASVSSKQQESVTLVKGLGPFSPTVPSPHSSGGRSGTERVASSGPVVPQPSELGSEHASLNKSAEASASVGKSRRTVEAPVKVRASERSPSQVRSPRKAVSALKVRKPVMSVSPLKVRKPVKAKSPQKAKSSKSRLSLQKTANRHQLPSPNDKTCEKSHHTPGANEKSLTRRSPSKAKSSEKTVSRSSSTRKRDASKVKASEKPPGDSSLAKKQSSSKPRSSEKTPSHSSSKHQGLSKDLSKSKRSSKSKSGSQKSESGKLTAVQGSSEETPPSKKRRLDSSGEGRKLCAPDEKETQKAVEDLERLFGVGGVLETSSDAGNILGSGHKRTGNVHSALDGGRICETARNAYSSINRRHTHGGKHNALHEDSNTEIDVVNVSHSSEDAELPDLHVRQSQDLLAKQAGLGSDTHADGINQSRLSSDERLPDAEQARLQAHTHNGEQVGDHSGVCENLQGATCSDTKRSETVTVKVSETVLPGHKTPSKANGRLASDESDDVELLSSPTSSRHPIHRLLSMPCFDDMLTRSPQKSGNTNLGPAGKEDTELFNVLSIEDSKSAPTIRVERGKDLPAEAKVPSPPGQGDSSSEVFQEVMAAAGVVLEDSPAKSKSALSRCGQKNRARLTKKQGNRNGGDFPNEGYFVSRSEREIHQVGTPAAFAKVQVRTLTYGFDTSPEKARPQASSTSNVLSTQLGEGHDVHSRASQQTPGRQTPLPNVRLHTSTPRNEKSSRQKSRERRQSLKPVQTWGLTVPMSDVMEELQHTGLYKQTMQKLSTQGGLYKPIMPKSDTSPNPSPVKTVAASSPIVSTVAAVAVANPSQPVTGANLPGLGNGATVPQAGHDGVKTVQSTPGTTKSAAQRQPRSATKSASGKKQLNTTSSAPQITNSPPVGSVTCHTIPKGNRVTSHTPDSRRVHDSPSKSASQTGCARSSAYQMSNESTPTKRNTGKVSADESGLERTVTEDSRNDSFSSNASFVAVGITVHPSPPKSGTSGQPVPQNPYRQNAQNQPSLFSPAKSSRAAFHNLISVLEASPSKPPPRGAVMVSDTEVSLSSHGSLVPLQPVSLMPPPSQTPRLNSSPTDKGHTEPEIELCPETIPEGLPDLEITYVGTPVSNNQPLSGSTVTHTITATTAKLTDKGSGVKETATVSQTQASGSRQSYIAGSPATVMAAETLVSIASSHSNNREEGDGGGERQGGKKRKRESSSPGKKRKKEDEQGPAPAPKEKAVHVCSYCGKVFSKPSDLTRHVRIHTNDRPYKCHLCSRAYCDNATLQKHLRSHERGFVIPPVEEAQSKVLRCSTCNFRAKNPSHLQWHVAKHEEEEEAEKKRRRRKSGKSSPSKHRKSGEGQPRKENE